MQDVIKVLLVEDDVDLAAAAVRALSVEGFDVTAVGTVADALERAAECDVALVDLGLPDAIGFEACSRVVGTGIPTLVATARDAEVDRIVCFELGVDDYVCKPYSMREVGARLRVIARRAARGAEPATVPETATGRLAIDERTRVVKLDGEQLQLTVKEFDLLAVLASDAGRVWRRIDLLTRVWGDDFYGSGKTLDVHVAALRRKLGDPEWVRAVRGVGFQLSDPTEALAG